jgi:hypothetical protein
VPNASCWSTSTANNGIYSDCAGTKTLEPDLFQNFNDDGSNTSFNWKTLTSAEATSFNAKSDYCFCYETEDDGPQCTSTFALTIVDCQYSNTGVGPGDIEESLGVQSETLAAFRASINTDAVCWSDANDGIYSSCSASTPTLESSLFTSFTHDLTSTTINWKTFTTGDLGTQTLCICYGTPGDGEQCTETFELKVVCDYDNSGATPGDMSRSLGAYSVSENNYKAGITVSDQNCWSGTSDGIYDCSAVINDTPILKNFVDNGATTSFDWLALTAGEDAVYNNVCFCYGTQTDGLQCT